MPKDATKTRKAVFAALEMAFSRAMEQEVVEGKIALDIHSAKLVIFSDHHRGNRDGADDFKLCERAYNAALAYYNRLGYTLVIIGDADELWEEWPRTVVNAYAHTLELEGKFLKGGRYLRVWGNHDDAWSHPDIADQILAPKLGCTSLKIHEALIIHMNDEGEECGRLFLLHGHQGTLESDRFAAITRFIVRYVWRPVQRIFKISINAPARDFELRFAHDCAMYSWSETKQKIVLIAGHTHRPVFKSISHEAVIRRSLEKVEKKLAKSLDNQRVRQKAAALAAELEWILAQNQQPVKTLPAVEFNKPSYFNAGCCAFLDGDITGLEISDGEIRLVRWPDDEDLPKPKVLKSADLKEVFAAC